jgi:hypothetical protein
MIGNYIKAVAAAVSRSTAQLMKTGQTTSYRTGDDGDIEAGRNVDFFTLAENNPFGNTDRFTDELGGTTYTNNIVIDWATYDGSSVLGYRKSEIFIGNWNASIDYCNTLSVGTFTSGWRMPNIVELINIINYGIPGTALSVPHIGNFLPFVISNPNIISSTTNLGNTFEAFRGNGPVFIQWNKGNNNVVLPCRTFTVTGTILS